jgi:prepilin-type N-terminal cleavage/methylation domain-containing protein
MVRQVQGGPRGPRGFTLIELTIVLLILVAIAGVMIPFMNGYVDKAHSGAAAANIESITRQVESYKVKHLFKGYPDNLDSLMDIAGTGISPTIPTAAANSLEVATATTLTADQVASLSDAGLKTVWHFSTAPGNATFDMPDAHATISSTNVLLVTTAAAPNVVPNADTTNWTYVLLGLGNKADIVGTDIAEAPVHFDAIDPAQYYQHYGLIFAVPTAANTDTSAATHLVATVGIHDGGLSGLRDHLTEFNDSNK